ncbi:mitochondrial fission ELM1 family protein [Caulobacter sp. SL161]|uniref:mitochondrial fission ELM1 family protein n=1 Tax=Caulobacter sp. SL161 TaxID=2995156 RepID=UPI002275D410|nr:mitochondrial fission ELM1 family protein [Caulobacter sp. SL161]MCY1648768.1 mitochondrial fission ELM1 family protein [Caulobacter sp. SL161]
MTKAGPSPSKTSPLKVWAVSDGRAGIEAQVVGLSEALARLVPCEVTVKRVGWQGNIGRLPWWLNLLPKRWLTPESGVPDRRNPDDWPDLWIAAGRATLPLSIRAKRWSGGKTFVVQIQDPRVPPHMFDLVIPPKHDRMSGDNILPITGSPHRVTPQRLAAEYEAFQDLIEPLPRPRVAVLVGGKSKAFDLSSERAAQIAHSIQIPLEQDGGSLLMTFSRRTPETARALMTARLRHLPGVVWNGEGPNPYFAFLAAADYILVTEDSTNMATEAASTGKPVFVLKMDGSSLKFRLFHEELERQGAARPYGGAFHGWTYDPVNETDRAAREVLARIGVEVAEPVAEPEPAPVEKAKAKAKPKPKARPGAEAKAPSETAAPKVRKPRAAKAKS